MMTYTYSQDMQPYCRKCRDVMVNSGSDGSKNWLDQWVWSCATCETVPDDSVVLGKPLSDAEVRAWAKEHRKKELETQLEAEFPS